ncbi:MULTISPECIES: hypothetical protein [Serratia]|uniref:hypothetical protein n=1 Tax=Serratia TaxID=613 RepID=UPI00065F875B|nr:hypothetical protein [Serratia sp. 506_PEND]
MKNRQVQVIFTFEVVGQHSSPVQDGEMHTHAVGVSISTTGLDDEQPGPQHVYAHILHRHSAAVIKAVGNEFSRRAKTQGAEIIESRIERKYHH